MNLWQHPTAKSVWSFSSSRSHAGCCFAVVTFAWLCIVPWSAEAAGKTQVRLLLPVETAKAGEEILAGLEMRMPAGWHTYWRNHGDAGASTEIKWQLPKGVSAGEIRWPVPEKLNDREVYTYAYEGTTVLLVPLKLASDLPPGEIELKAAVSWVECEKNCIPGNGNVQAKFTVASETKPSSFASVIQSATQKLPKNGAPLNATARWDGSARVEQRPLVIQWDSATPLEVADFFPDAGAGYKIEGATKRLDVGEGKQAIRKLVTKTGRAGPKEVKGLIVTKASVLLPKEAYEVTLDLRADPNAGPQPALLAMLGFAFLGGLILNIMPCVLPVIALKVLGFVNQSKESPRRVRQLGVIYTLGVLTSFIVLAGVIIGLQQAGRAAYWGMQFQNPQFVVVMTALVTLVALNLFGVFEVTCGGQAMDTAGALASREGNAGAFFNGVLATVLATPCTAPFLTPAIGFAFAQPPALIVLVFSVIALGLAAPYLILSFQPAWTKFLPRPGAWMEKFKIALGFPMLATTAYLLWLTTDHFGRDGALWIGLFLVALAAAAWVWGEFGQRSSRRLTARLVSIGMVLFAYFVILEGQLRWRAPEAAPSAGAERARKPGDLDWQVWSSDAVAAARAAGHPVLLDFTANWCVNCKVNEKTSLNIPSVKKKLEEINGIAFLADYSRRDPAITDEIERLGRVAIPLTVVYPANPSAPPIILETLLTPGRVLEALDKAASTKTNNGR